MLPRDNANVDNWPMPLFHLRPQYQLIAQVVNQKRRQRDPFESEFHPRRAKTRSGGD